MKKADEEDNMQHKTTMAGLSGEAEPFPELHAVQEGLPGTRRGRRMKLGKGERIQVLDSAKAEELQVPEFCVGGLPPLSSLFFSYLCFFHSPLPSPRKGSAFPVGLVDLLRWGCCVAVFVKLVALQSENTAPFL